MKQINENRYIVTDCTAIGVIKFNYKKDAYKQATGLGWGTVDIDINGEMYCDEDCNSDLYGFNGEYTGISPYEELDQKTWLKQAQCKAIITSDSCGFAFWGEDVKIFVTYDQNGLIDSYRVDCGKPYENETELSFEDLTFCNPYEY